MCKRPRKKKERAIKKKCLSSRLTAPVLLSSKSKSDWRSHGSFQKDQQPLLSFCFHSILSSTVYIGTPFLSTLSFAPKSFFRRLSVFVILSPLMKRPWHSPRTSTNSLTLGSVCSLSIFLLSFLHLISLHLMHIVPVNTHLNKSHACEQVCLCRRGC